MSKFTNAQYAIVLTAIETLAPEGKKSVHTVWSGLNDYLRRKHNLDPVALTTEMKEKGLIDTRPFKGGVLIYKKGDMQDGRAADVDAKMEAALKGKVVLRKAEKKEAPVTTAAPVAPASQDDVLKALGL